MDDLAAAILASSENLGIDPVDLATAISYETAGTFDPWKAGPTTKWGQHRGLIQWGEPQRAEYGVRQGMPVADQLRAVEKYLRKAGVRPGHGLLDVYSAINAGKVGRYGASDTAAGGAPGTVRDKVLNQMDAHRAKAAALLGRSGPAVVAQTPATTPVPAPSPIASLFLTPEPAFVPDANTPMVNVVAEAQAERAAADRARRLALFSGPSSFG
jgi:hypothetical protein